jgi:hypothetical protein
VNNWVPLRDAERAAKKESRVEKPREPAPDRDVGKLPMRTLGHFRGEYYFADAVGQIRALNAKQVQDYKELVGLMGGDTGAAVAMWPAMDKEGEPTGRFNGQALGASLIIACVQAGLFDPDTPRLGLGVWQAGENVLVHLGGQLVELNGTSRRTLMAGVARAGKLYVAVPSAITPPAFDAPATTDLAREIEAIMERWNWHLPGSARLVLGYAAAAMLGTATRWRPHLLVVGGSGGGKTTLMEALAELIPGGMFRNDFTEAGLRQWLSERAAGLILDEAEGGTGPMGRMESVIEFLRRASGGGGARSVRGSPGGKATTFSVSAAAALGAILPPALLPQDASRFTRVDLRPREQGAALLDAEAIQATFRAAAPALWARLLLRLPQFRTSLALLRDVLIDGGATPRLADQLGTLLAARSALVHDFPLTLEAAVAEVDAVRAWVAVESDAADLSGPERCLTHLLMSAADLSENGQRPTLGNLLDRLRHGATTESHLERVLADHGLRHAPAPPSKEGQQMGSGDGLMIADSHPRLARAFDNTPWARGRWREDLLRLAGAYSPRNPQRIGGAKPRVTWVPEACLPDREDVRRE